MKILHVCQGYPPVAGGCEYWMQRVSETLAREWGDEVTVLCADGDGGATFNDPAAPRLPRGESISHGVRVRRLYTVRWPGQWLDRLSGWCAGSGLQWPLAMAARGPRMPQLPGALLGGDWDMVLAGSFPCAHMLPVTLLRPLGGYPLVLFGAYHPREAIFNNPFTWQLARAADAYVAATEYERATAVANGVAPDRAMVIGGGGDPDWCDGTDRDAARRELGLEGLVLLSAGQLVPGKGFETVLAAMARLADARPELTLIIAGSSHHPFAGELRRRVEALPAPVRSRVRLVTDFPPELKPKLFAAADLFVFPSGTDSFGLVIAEAWGAGLPVIVGDHPPQRSFIRAGEDGEFVPLDDPPALATTIVRLADDPGRRARLGAAGRERVRTEFNWERIAAKLRELYLRIIRERSAR